MDKWIRSFGKGLKCLSCMFYCPKDNEMGRCKRHAPTMNGYPVVYSEHDWCGDHKMGTNPDKMQTEDKINTSIIQKEKKEGL